jgi:hypothetical protein
MPEPKPLLRYAAAASALLMVVIALLAGAIAYQVFWPHPAGSGSAAAPGAAAGGSAPAAGGAAGCLVERSGTSPFRAIGARDTLHVRIAGDSCARAHLRIHVESEDGTLLYAFEGDFAPPAAQGPPREAAEAFADEVLASAGAAGTTAELAPWEDALAYYADQPRAVIVDRATYDALRASRRPILWHATPDGHWRAVIYDPQTQTARVILAGELQH